MQSSDVIPNRSGASTPERQFTAFLHMSFITYWLAGMNIYVKSDVWMRVAGNYAEPQRAPDLKLGAFVVPTRIRRLGRLMSSHSTTSGRRADLIRRSTTLLAVVLFSTIPMLRRALS